MSDMVTLKELAERYGISERKARKLLRINQNEKDTNYFWKFIANSSTLSDAEKTLDKAK